MKLSVAFYKCRDNSLKKVFKNDGFKVYYTTDIYELDNYTVVVYNSNTIDEEEINKLKLEELPELHDISSFIQNNLTHEEHEFYYLDKFLEQEKLQDVDLDSFFKDKVYEDINVDSMKELYEKYMIVCQANVHLVDTDVIFDNNQGYMKGLLKVYDTSTWEEGDVVVVKKALNHGSNYGKFMYVNGEILPLDNIVDTDEGHIVTQCDVISNFPINYWASNFMVDNEVYRIVENNSLVMCKLDNTTFSHIIESRKNIINKIISENSISDEERVILFEYDQTKYAFICEFGIDVDEDVNLKKIKKQCDEILIGGCDHSLYIQFPRFIENIKCSEMLHLVEKKKYMNNLEIYKIPKYKTIIDYCVQNEVLPCNIALIDCGYL